MNNTVSLILNCGSMYFLLTRFSQEVKHIGQPNFGKHFSHIRNLSTRWTSQRKIADVSHRSSATEKIVPIGSLYMRPIQWHLKYHWNLTESLDKRLPIHMSLHYYTMYLKVQGKMFTRKKMAINL